MNLLHSHPFIGFILSGGFLFSGSAIPYTDVVIPPLAMQLLQITCWGIGVVIAIKTYNRKK